MKKLLIACMFLMCAGVGKTDCSLEQLVVKTAQFITENDTNYFAFLGLQGLAALGFTLGATYGGYKTTVSAKKMRILKKQLEALKRQNLSDQDLSSQALQKISMESLNEKFKDARLDVATKGFWTVVCFLGAMLSGLMLWQSWATKAERKHLHDYARDAKAHIKNVKKLLKKTDLAFKELKGDDDKVLNEDGRLRRTQGDWVRSFGNRKIAKLLFYRLAYHEGYFTDICHNGNKFADRYGELKEEQEKLKEEK